MNATRIGLVGVAATVLLVVATVALPTITGPVVECGELEQAVCEDVWRQVASDIEGQGPVGILPVTRAQVVGATQERPRCGTFTIERSWVFAWIVTYDCF